MVQRGILAAMKDVPIMLRKEECVGDMVQRSLLSAAAMKDATTTYRKEEYVLDMVQRSSSAVMKDVPITPSKVEFV